VSGKTLRSFFQEYVEGGIGRLKEVHFRQPQSELALWYFALIACH
jgi:hypothetical protein